MWHVVLGGLCAVAVLLRVVASRAQSKAEAAAQGSDAALPQAAVLALAKLRTRFLVVFLTVKFADWLQGPYFYDVLATKVHGSTGVQFSAAEVSALFLVGFCSSMLFGALAGSWADSVGRCVLRARARPATSLTSAYMREPPCRGQAWWRRGPGCAWTWQR
jgi:hypothetical protein